MAAVVFREFKPEDGFDGRAIPAWLMVPANHGIKEIRVDSGSLKVNLTSSFEGVAKVSPAPTRGKGVWLVEGIVKGSAYIEARAVAKEAELERLLEVSVKDVRPVTVKFYLVRDKNHMTKRDQANAEDLLKRINNIHTPQDNVRFDFHSAQTLPIDEDLGDVVDFQGKGFATYMEDTPENHKWHAITKHGDPDHATFNVFCVWKFLARENPGYVGYTTGNTSMGTKHRPNNNMCLFSDEVEKNNLPGQILAHEAGHYLGFGREHYKEKSDMDLLMFESGAGGIKILKQDANAFNP
jgi:hypothetical protein